MHKRLKVGWFQREVSNELQQWYLDYINGLRPAYLIEAPPQHGKSTIISDFVLWLIGKDSETETNNLKIIYSAFSDRLSTRANRYIYRFTRTNRYKEIFPKYKANTENQESISFGDSDGYFRNTTCGGAITGESMDIGILDDILKGREEANSKLIRDKKYEWLVSDFMTRFSEFGGLLGIMTRWHVDDPFGRLIKVDSNIRVLKYKAIAETNEKHRKKGEALFPEHKSLKFLLKIKKIMSASAWNSLYQQNPIIESGNFFKPDLMPIVEAAPKGLKYIRTWDLAGTEGAGDYTAGLKFGYDYKNQVGYVCHVKRGQWGVENVESAIKNTANADGKQVKIKLPQDPAQAGKSQAKNFAKLLAGYDVEFELQNGSKETRASPAAAQCNVGNIYLVKGDWNEEFIEELRHFPNGVNDDQVDALSTAYNHFVSVDAEFGYIPVPRNKKDDEREHEQRKIKTGNGFARSKGGW